MALQAVKRLCLISNQTFKYKGSWARGNKWLVQSHWGHKARVCCCQDWYVALQVLPLSSSPSASWFHQNWFFRQGRESLLICFWNKIFSAICNTPENRNITKSLFCVNTSISSYLGNQSELLSSCLKRQGHLIHSNFLFPFSQRLY